MTIDIPTDDITPVIESVASEYGRRYHRYGADREDFSQGLWLWVFDHPVKVVAFLEDAEYGVKTLARTLRNEAHDMGEDVKAQHLGYSRDDLMHYSKNMLKDLLPAVFDEEAWLHPEQSDGERRRQSVPAEGGNWVATLADVARGFELLEASDRDLLLDFHANGYTNKMMADREHVTEQTMSYRHDRAVKRLVDVLGGPKPRPQHDAECDHAWRGGRHATSNASARAAQSGYYDE